MTFMSVNLKVVMNVEHHRVHHSCVIFLFCVRVCMFFPVISFLQAIPLLNSNDMNNNRVEFITGLDLNYNNNKINTKNNNKQM